MMIHDDVIKTLASWDAVLDNFETALDAYVAVTTQTDFSDEEPIALPSFEVPVDLGPLSKQQSLRVQELVARSRSIQTELERVRERVFIDLTRGRRPSGYAVAETSNYVDRLA